MLIQHRIADVTLPRHLQDVLVEVRGCAAYDLWDLRDGLYDYVDCEKLGEQ